MCISGISLAAGCNAIPVPHKGYGTQPKSMVRKWWRDISTVVIESVQVNCSWAGDEIHAIRCQQALSMIMMQQMHEQHALYPRRHE